MPSNAYNNGAGILQNVATRLGGRRLSDFSYQCHCPCHEDNKESLTITVKEDGRLLFYCHAGCSWDSLKEYFRKDIEENMKLQATSRRHYRAPKIRTIDKLETIYFYRRDNLSAIMSVIRFEGKVFRVRAQDGVWKKPETEEARSALYNWERREKAKTFVLCEGEKDCDSVNRLIEDSGYLAVTNQGGAASFYREHADKLSGRRVIIIEDNDEAGRKRTKKVLEMLGDGVFNVVRFETERDISDWIALKQPTPERLIALLETRLPNRPVSKSLRKKRASREDYIALFTEVLGEMRRDIFSGSLMCKNDEGIWASVHNYRSVLESEVVERDRTNSRYFASHVGRHLSWLENNKTRELIVDIPRWDGKDRIKEMCFDAVLDEECGSTNEGFELLTKEWFSLAFQRLLDPSIRNSIIVLVGPQRIGKDYWINTLVDGLGQFASSLDALRGDKDSYMALHYSLILKISEFDKTNKGDASFIKDLITKQSTTLRKSFGVDPQFRWARPSFIASCNPDDFLKDWTGNDRYYVFKIKNFKKEYKNTEEYRMQILAQALVLSRESFIAPPWCREVMHGYIAELTPKDPAEEIVELWLAFAKEYVEGLVDNILKDEIIEDGIIANYRAHPILEKIYKTSGIKLREIRAFLSRLGFLDRNKSGSSRGIRIYDRRVEPDKYKK